LELNLPGFFVAGNLKAEGGHRAWVGAIRHSNLVPMDFLSAEALGTETLWRCAACKKCEECQFKVNVLVVKRKC
jgi:hypothetical protein